MRILKVELEPLFGDDNDNVNDWDYHDVNYEDDGD